MAEDLRTFKTFNDPELALSFGEILQENNISFEIEEDALNFDPSYANDPLNKDFRLKIKQSDFPKANKALEQFYRQQLDTVDKGYYLFDFTDEELMEILAKPDEWGHFDYLLAQRILEQRGKPVSKEKIDEMMEERIQEFAQPEKPDRSLMILGYFLAFLFPLIGIFIGLMMDFSKKTLPNGKSVYSYDDKQRKHGERIWIISAAMLTIYLLGAIANQEVLWFKY